MTKPALTGARVLDPSRLVPGGVCSLLLSDLDDEVARTGLHAANRLASDNLQQDLVVGSRAGKASAEHAVDADAHTAVLPEPSRRCASTRADLQRAMTRHESLVRDCDEPERLTTELDTAQPRILKSRGDFEDVAPTTAVGAVAALARTDFPSTDPALVHSLPVAASDEAQ